MGLFVLVLICIDIIFFFFLLKHNLHRLEFVLVRHLSDLYVLLTIQIFCFHTKNIMGKFINITLYMFFIRPRNEIYLFINIILFLNLKTN